MSLLNLKKMRQIEQDMAARNGPQVAIIFKPDGRITDVNESFFPQPWVIAKTRSSVQEGVSLVEQTSTALQSILTRMQAIDTNVGAISQSSLEQAGGISQINSAIGALDRGTQRNASVVEEANAASQALADEAEGLKALVGKFKVQGSRRAEPLARVA